MRRFFALLPVRFDDARFWPRAALGLALRWAVLAGTFLPLRDAVAWAVAQSLGAVGLSATLLEGATLGVGADRIAITVPCTHLEIVALLAPLCWDRTRSALRNVALLMGAGAAVLALAIPRIDLAIVLLRAGVPWSYGHDALLGLCYFALLASVLAAGAWTRPPRASTVATA